VISPRLTIFTAPKPFEGHIGLIQENAIDSWLALGEAVEVLLIGDEPGMVRVAQARGLRHLPAVERNAYGTPLLSSIFALARQEAAAPILCYANADILFLSDLLEAMEWVNERYNRYLLVGQRWDLDLSERLGFEKGWESDLRTRLQADGRLHKPAGSDYFVFPKDLFGEIPEFALGRAGWDNWMIYAGRALRVPVIDATERITVVHQQHDYGHLPGGQPHYHLPESQENVALGGGREIVFTLRDCSHRLTHNGIEAKRPRSLGEWRRWLLVRAVVRFGPGKRARLLRMLLYPGQTARYYGRRLLDRNGRGTAGKRQPGKSAEE